MAGVLVWDGIPTQETVRRACARYGVGACVFLADAWDGVTGYLKSCAAGAVNFLLPEHNPYGRSLWVMPFSEAEGLAEYGFTEIFWQNLAPVAQRRAAAKPWFRLPEPLPAENVIVVGAGIAGAATAFALARRGVAVSVVEQAERPASAASGNPQGLLYAKISAYATVQTRLLLAAYGFSRRLLAECPPAVWTDCGVLHLNHDEGERRRNAALAAQTENRHLYRAVGAAEAEQLAGVALGGQDGLFWPLGGAVRPSAWVEALLSQSGIRVLTGRRLAAIRREGGVWQAVLAGRAEPLSGSHIVFCTGAAPFPQGVEPLPLHRIRGQTTLAAAGGSSRRLRCALSGKSYLVPPYGGHYCFGASFVPHDADTAWRLAEDEENRRAVAALLPDAALFSGACMRGHTALRADCHDHLPAVGPLGDFVQMRRDYARLADDRNFPLDTPCAYLPGLFANTAHGSRGLATAPLCGELLAAQLCGEPLPMAADLVRALMPNRLLIRALVHSKNAASAKTAAGGAV